MKPQHLFRSISSRSLFWVFLQLIVCNYLNAQVITLNVVGYVNVALSANRYQLLSNPLSANTNTLNGAVLNPSNGSRAWIWNVTNQVFEGPSVFDAALNLWSIDYPLPVGKGFMIHSPTNTTITFVGEVLTGTRTNLVAGTNKLSLLGSIVPQSGGLSTVLGFPPSDGDNVYHYSVTNQQYVASKIYFAGFGWFPTEPTNLVAEAFFVRHRGSDTNWIRSFSPRLEPTASSDSVPGIDSYTIRDGTITLKINKAVKRYNVQFSSDRENWSNVAINQTAAIWKGTLPAGSTGFFQIVQP